MERRMEVIAHALCPTRLPGEDGAGGGAAGLAQEGVDVGGTFPAGVDGHTWGTSESTGGKTNLDPWPNGGWE